MNAQEIFTKVKNHLLKQNEVSQEDRIHCKYRGPNGLQCAVGCLIPDKVYYPALEGVGIGPVTTRLLRSKNSDRKELGKLFKQHAKLLKHLQSVHDNLDPRYWPEGLHDVANKFKLEY